MIDIEKANKAFDEYVNSFDMNNNMIKLKYEHTYRVCKQSLEICKSIGLDDENTDLAYLIALLHDIGRFYQAKEYGSYDDSKTVDHANLGCKILFDHGLIRNFIDDNKYDNTIYNAVYYHNKYSIPNLNANKLLHAKIVRDADKIDIIHNVVDIGQIKLPEDDNGIGDKVKEDFELEVSVNHEHKTSKNDATLTMVAFVFDLNFGYSFEYFKKNEFVNKIYNKLVNKELFKPYIDKANNYVERKCEDVKYKIFA